MLNGHRPAIFIDKGGTLVEDLPFNVDPAQLRFLCGAPQALAALAQHGYALIVASNQSGLARGSFTRAQFARLQHALERRLRVESGVALLDFVVCPHAPAPNGSPQCLCRKPAPGLMLRAARRHGLDLARSWMIGNTLDDVEAGRRAGCRAVMLDNGGETAWRRTPLRKPEARLASWDEITRHILSTEATLAER